MAKRKLFNEWYGYDKKVILPETTELPDSTKAIKSASYSWRAVDTSIVPYITDESAKAILARFKRSKEIIPASTRWHPPADGRTEEDFINWVNTVEFTQKDLNRLPYSTIPWYASLHGLKDRNLERKVREFFKFDEPRSDMIFRLIELSEFMNRADDTQTFEQFLLTDEISAEKCRNLDLTSVGQYKDLVSQNAPRFFSFGRGVGQNTRDLFLPLVKSEMAKVLDFQNNPMLNANWIKSYSYEWADLFFKTALGQRKILDIKIYPVIEIQEYLMYRIIEKFEQDSAKNKTKAIRLLMEICHALNYLHLDEDGCRGMSYLIETGVIAELSPLQIMAVACGYEESKLWAEPEKGMSSIEISIELMHEGVVSPKEFCELISHIVVNEQNPIRVERDFDWNIIKDVLIDWAYTLLPPAKNTRPPQIPSIIERMLKP